MMESVFWSVVAFFNQGWVGALVGIVGVGFGAYQLYRKERAELAFQWYGLKIIKPRKDAFKDRIVVLYNDAVVKQLSITYIAFWNSGRRPLRSEDVVAQSPVRISLPVDASILEYNVVSMTRGSNQCSFDKDGENALRFNFRFLDRNDGVVVRIVHTSADVKPIVSGTVIGASDIKDLGFWLERAPASSLRSMGEGERLRTLVRMFFLDSLGPAVFLGVFGILLSTASFFYDEINAFSESMNSYLKGSDRLVGFFFGPILVAGSLAALLSRRRRPPRQLSRRDRTKQTFEQNKLELPSDDDKLNTSDVAMLPQPSVE